MSDLATTCGLTKGAFYHHFSSKEEVMKNCLSITSDWFENYVFSIAYDTDIEDKEKFRKMSQIIFKAFTKEAGGCFFANTILETAHVEDTFKDIIKKFYAMWEEAFTHIFSTKFSKKKAKKLSVRTIIDIEGSIILMQLHDDVKYLKKSIKRCINYY